MIVARARRGWSHELGVCTASYQLIFSGLLLFLLRSHTSWPGTFPWPTGQSSSRSSRTRHLNQARNRSGLNSIAAAVTGCTPMRHGKQYNGITWNYIVFQLYCFPCAHQQPVATLRLSQYGCVLGFACFVAFWYGPCLAIAPHHARALPANYIVFLCPALETGKQYNWATTP
eukprot:SAG31_NODE_9570_length_1257_cov_1.620035_1_plen_171_part_10